MIEECPHCEYDYFRVQIRYRVGEVPKIIDFECEICGRDPRDTTDWTRQDWEELVFGDPL